jgi:hypothetical protein
MTPPEPHGPPQLGAATRRALAAGLYNQTWTLLDVPSRTIAQDDEMVHTAHASRFHWGEVGLAVNLARGEWLCSRVYAVLGRAEPAVHHARRCVELTESNPDREDWDLAAAYEAMARAQLVAGDRLAASGWQARARVALGEIADPEDRSPIEADLESLAALASQGG